MIGYVRSVALQAAKNSLMNIAIVSQHNVGTAEAEVLLTGCVGKERQMGNQRAIWATLALTARQPGQRAAGGLGQRGLWRAIQQAPPIRHGLPSTH